MKIKNISTFIASTLPIEFILNNHSKLKINKIYVPNSKLYKSAYYIQEIISKEIKIIRLPENKFKQFFYLLLIFGKCKYQGEKIIFFHELSWLIFDLAFYFTKPKYNFYPQVTLNGWNSLDELMKKKIKGISYKSKLFNKVFIILAKLKIAPKLKIYFTHNETDRINEYTPYFACQEYKISKLNYKKIYTKANKIIEGKFIILCGIGGGDKKEQKEILEYVVKEISQKGFQIQLKGHPNFENIYPENIGSNIEIIDKYIPFEILDSREFIGIIGFGSTVLCRYPKKSLSMLNFIKSRPKELIRKQKLHLSSLNKDENCFYPKNEEEFIKSIDSLIIDFNKD